MKRLILASVAALIFAGAVAPAQVVVHVGDRHHRHCWYSHHHRHCR